ncbi:hypothetical protein F5050DRAFT_1808355 [Lentinula boryana]|uniref:Uncharacterized protein n=1 Tax=Lentinula boryana TaxID=40481 RepID=A0ABQ8QB83_9AGAR|nr:hypothetical protein F5050DRAFT_1808355 [Lentinula boryana]
MATSQSPHFTQPLPVVAYSAVSFPFPTICATMLTDYELSSLRPIFSRADLLELEEAVQDYLGTSLIEIDTFLSRRIYFTNFCLPHFNVDYLDPIGYKDKTELSMITNRYLQFPRNPTRVTLFVPAPPELYPPGEYEQLCHDEEGICTSGSEYFVCWGLWIIALDTNYQGTLEQYNQMPISARVPCEGFSRFYGPHDTMSDPERLLVRYTFTRFLPQKNSH